jgi:hypothetical protein
MRRRTIAILAAAFLAWGFWHAEIFWVRGWYSLTWTGTEEFNFIAISACAVVPAAAAFAVAPCPRPEYLRLFILPSRRISLAAFSAGRMEMIEMFAGWQIAFWRPCIGGRRSVWRAHFS